PVWNKILNAIKAPLIIQNALALGMVYVATCFAWIYFRSPDFNIASQVITGIGSLEGFNFGSVINKFLVLKGVLVIGILLLVELLDLRSPLYKVTISNPYFRVASFAILLWLIAFFGTFGSNSFIYFQF
ncbi:MAG: alginate O-acetyltransferase complex protein AlgI, partial [Saprospiraceae bacterium]